MALIFLIVVALFGYYFLREVWSFVSAMFAIAGLVLKFVFYLPWKIKAFVEQRRFLKNEHMEFNFIRPAKRSSS
jgi:hypothetical protein